MFSRKKRLVMTLAVLFFFGIRCTISLVVFRWLRSFGCRWFSRKKRSKMKKILQFGAALYCFSSSLKFVGGLVCLFIYTIFFSHAQNGLLRSGRKYRKQRSNTGSGWMFHIYRRRTAWWRTTRWCQTITEFRRCRCTRWCFNSRNGLVFETSRFIMLV